MIPETVNDPRPPRKQIADPSYRQKRVGMIARRMSEYFDAACASTTKKERAFYLEMADTCVRKIKWYLR